MTATSLFILQHEKAEPAGIFEEVARTRGISSTVVPLFETHEVPPVTSTHLLVLGGSMSVNDGARYPFIDQEKRLIRSWIAKGRPVLGICLGAQMIAAACGGEISPCRKEIGWVPLEVIDIAVLPGVPRSFMAFQLHGETFSLPAGADLVCRGKEVPHQALAVGSALGLQFHLEPTEQMIRLWLSEFHPGEQSRILQDTARYLAESHRLCRIVCDRFFQAAPRGFCWRCP
ncbi:MAG TPA: type 1 glutamine amidotransferase [Methanolinea sp.]|nr:MAG: GMP synthase (glutamine-hydrolyzing) subunit A [Methanoregulaceae archaeon PtaU1.Bin066]HII76856.1 type 1 glutamine amidotransferase [Methanolinea sp.]HNQ29311.1 type 1 glutamine amidotransferase [Methanolinea sp.]